MNFPRRKKKQNPPEHFDRTINANQIVGVNFRLARELRGWTQEEVGRKLGELEGRQVLPKASISAIERGIDRDRRKVFNAQELVDYSLVFDLPITWFFLPIEEGVGVELEGTGRPAAVLLEMVLGDEEQRAELAEHVRARREWMWKKRSILDDVYDFPSWQHFQESRELLLTVFAHENETPLARIFTEMKGLVNRVDAIMKTIPTGDDIAALADFGYVPSTVFRRTSETLIGKSAYFIAVKDSMNSTSVSQLLNRRDLPIEEWVDFEDPAVQKSLKAFYKAVDEQLRDKEFPPFDDARTLEAER